MIMPVLTVKDYDASLAYYRDTLKMEVTMSMATHMSTDGKDDFAFVGVSESSQIGLSLAADLPTGGAGVDLMVYLPESMDIDAYYAQVKQNGATIVREIADEYWGDRIFAVTDPDGYRLTFARTVKQMTPEEIAQLTSK